MEPGNGVGCGRHVVRAEIASFETEIEALALVELPHPDGVLDRGLFTDFRCLERSPDRHHAEVDVRCGPGIESQLVLTKGPAARQIRKVEEPQVDRFLDLVGVISRQEDPRDVGFDQLDLTDRMRVCIRPEQAADEAARRGRRISR